MSFSAEMPFSRASACMASRISRDMCVLLLDEVRTVDVGVRNRDDPAVGGDRHGVGAGAHQLTGERLMSIALLARPDAGAAAEKAAVVIGFGQWVLAAR